MPGPVLSHAPGQVADGDFGHVQVGQIQRGKASYQDGVGLLVIRAVRLGDGPGDLLLAQLFGVTKSSRPWWVNTWPFALVGEGTRPDLPQAHIGFLSVGRGPGSARCGRPGHRKPHVTGSRTCV